jgi:hypothetical protein
MMTALEIRVVSRIAEMIITSSNIAEIVLYIFGIPIFGCVFIKKDNKNPSDKRIGLFDVFLAAIFWPIMIVFYIAYVSANLILRKGR